MLSRDRVDPTVFVAALTADLKAKRRYEIGFPGATDLSFPALSELLTGQLLNNIGDPHEYGRGRTHTKLVEQHVVSAVADLLRAPGRRWGYVTTGSTEAILHALDEGARRYPDAVVYTSAAAHYSVSKAARLLKLPLVTVAADQSGRIDLLDFRQALETRRHRPALVVATAGTTMTEAVDDVGSLVAICERLGVRHRRVHVDAALSGLPLALLPDEQRPRFDFTAGATSMAVSGHKFLGTLMPCGVLVYAGTPSSRSGANDISYTGSADSTIVSSRSGHTPLLLWWALTTLGVEGLRQRAESSRRLAQYTCEQLNLMGWPARVNPHAFTVILAPPPASVLEKWVLASDGDTAHIICMPGIARDQIDEFLSDLRAAMTPREQAAPVTAAPLVQVTDEGADESADLAVG